MIYHTEPLFQIIFGDSRSCFDPQILKNMSSATLAADQWGIFKRLTTIRNLVFLHQTHGNNGLIVESVKQAENLKLFSLEGDYLITDKPSIGLGIATADCLPIILYEPSVPVVAIVHAGWRGSVNQVAVAAVKHLQQKFLVKPSDLRVFFGPSAKQCCYKVKGDMIEALGNFNFKDEVLSTTEKGTFFNVPLFNQLQLEEVGVLPSLFHQAYNDCTICNKTFCSYRRDKNSYRQMTVVSLR